MTNINSPFENPFPAEIEKNVIFRYHSLYRPKLYFINEESVLTPVQQKELSADRIYLGIELEFDSRDRYIGKRANKIELISKSNEIFGNNTFAYYMNDGSLTNGLEMITQPATFEVHTSIEEKYKMVFNTIKEHGFKSDSYSTCGLHIHFNKNYFNENPDLYTVNLLYLTEKFWKDLVIFSRRNYNKIQRWADKYYEKPESVVDKFKKYGAIHSDRYRAINLTNSDTIEFRIYRGTLVPEYFYAILELTKNMIYFSKNKSVSELQSLKFEELLTSENLIRYNKFCHRKNVMKDLPSYI